MTSNGKLKTTVLIIGSGIAGCVAALELARHKIEVSLITSASEPSECNSFHAQGGIVYHGEQDSPEKLKKDMLVAGWNHNHVRSVQFLCEHGPRTVEEILLHRYQVPFNRDDTGKLRLTKEGGHGMARILFAADYTGKAIMQELIKAVDQEPNINILTCRTAIDLITSHHHSTKQEFHYQLANQCVGAYIFNQTTGQVETILADFTILATGGLGQLYLHTTNTQTSIGSGLTMAYRSGTKVMNCEFIQFHPTTLYQPGGQKFLISEAVRGEGAKFIRTDGRPFMQEYDPRADLAPRDIVSRAIVEELLKTGDDFVYLDAADFISKDIKTRFPTIYSKCLEAGLDITKDPIPVVPAAHFFCGGILCDLAGRTTLNRLYAIGECSCTGIHGANRLASTSLLEGLTWGWSAANSIATRTKKRSQLSKKLMASIPDWTSPGTEQEKEDPALIAQDWSTIKNTMWNYVGIIRTTARLKRAHEDLLNLNKRLYEFYKNTKISKPLIDLFHACQAAIIITRAALRNPHTQGCHYRQNK